MLTEKRTSDTLAVVSLVIGIISLVGFCCLGGFLGIVGVILAIIALTDVYCNKKALAIIGLLLSIFAFCFTIFLMIIGSVSGTIPDVAGMEYYDAKTEISKICGSDLDIDRVEEYSDTVSKGLVIRTEPGVDAEVNSGDTVKVIVSKGKKIVMPDIIGVDVEQAKKQLSDIGFEAYVIEEYSDTVEKGLVVSAQCEAGFDLTEVSDDIDIVVSKGSLQNLKESAKGVSYDDLIRYPESYKTTPIKFTATVSDLDIKSFLGIEYDTAIWASLNGKTVILYDNRVTKEPAVLEGDKITVYGYGDGTSTIETKQEAYQGSLVFGFSYDETIDSYKVPCVKIEYIDF